MSDKEYSEEFDRLRKNRVSVSFFKYGSARDNYGGGRVDAIATAERCIEAFKKDGNTEHLIPIASVYGSVEYAEDPEQMRLENYGIDCGTDKLKTTGCSRTGCIFCGFGCHLEKPGEGRFERLNYFARTGMLKEYDNE